MSASLREVEIPPLGKVCRLGLATRGNTHLPEHSIHTALDAGVNYLNWCGHRDGMREAVRNLGDRRSSVSVAVQFHARTADNAARELESILIDLQTDYLDVVTYYYVEHQQEWETISSPDGAAKTLEAAKADGRVRMVGLTSHQRTLAASAASSGHLDLLMIRYNAAHRGAEQDVFPTTSAREIPVVAFTCMRWGALLKPTSEDPPKLEPPSAQDCYRFVLQNDNVSVALMAPNDDAELRQNLSIVENWRDLSRTEFERIAEHGQRVRRLAGRFP